MLIMFSSHTSQRIFYDAYKLTVEDFKQSLKQLFTVVLRIRGKSSH